MFNLTNFVLFFVGILVVEKGWSSDYGGWASSLAQMILFPLGLVLTFFALAIKSSTQQRIASILSLSLNLALMILALYDTNRYGRFPEASRNLFFSSMVAFVFLLTDFYLRQKLQNGLLSQIKKILFRR